MVAPTPEPLTADLAALPWALGADGVMGPFRPEGGNPGGSSLARDQSGRAGSPGSASHTHRAPRDPAVSAPAGGRLRRYRDAHTAFVVCSAVSGHQECAAGGVGSVTAVEGYGASLRSASLPMRGGFWTCITQRNISGKARAAWLDGRTTQARRWFGWARHRLRHGKPDGVLADLAEALEVEGLPATARDPLAPVYAYYESPCNSRASESTKRQ